MISSSIMDLLLNKYVIGSLGVLISLIYAYFKGSAAARKDGEIADLEAARALQARIRAAEAKNQFLEKQGQLQNEKIDTADTIDELLGLWDEKHPKGSSTPPSTKPK
jgi:hypothetical protein